VVAMLPVDGPTTTIGLTVVEIISMEEYGFSNDPWQVYEYWFTYETPPPCGEMIWCYYRHCTTQTGTTFDPTVGVPLVVGTQYNSYNGWYVFYSDENCYISN